MIATLRRTLIICALVIGMVAAPAVAGTSSNSNTRAVVLFVGDSNVTLAAEQIDWTLTGAPKLGPQRNKYNGYVPVMMSLVGAAIRSPDCLDLSQPCPTNDYWQKKLASIAGKVTPDVIVTNLGINDTIEPGTETTRGYSLYARKIDWFMRLVPPTTPVLWSNLPCQIEPPERATGCAQVNWTLAFAPARWPNLVLVNWAAIANYHPEWMQTNNVHYTDAGHAAWVTLIADTLDQQFPAP